MSPGNRAIDMIMETLEEQRIEERVRAGVWPVQALWDEWGDVDLRRAVEESRLEGDVRGLCLEAVDTYLAQRAVQEAQGTPITYRQAALDLPKPPAREPSFWERLKLRAWAAISRGRARRK